MSDKEIAELNDLAGVSFDQFRITACKSMNKTLEWVDKFLQTEEGKNTEFVYRRHPSEWHSPILAEMAAKHKNFHLITDYISLFSLCQSIYIFYFLIIQYIGIYNIAIIGGGKDGLYAMVF